MWKILLGFVVFAALAIVVLMKGGDIDMGGEKHGADAMHVPAAASAAAADPTSAAASAPASAAK